MLEITWNTLFALACLQENLQVAQSVMPAVFQKNSPHPRQQESYK